MSVQLLWAVVRPERMPQVAHRLEAEGFYSITEIQVYGRGKQRGVQVGSASYDELAKTLLLLAVEEDHTQRAIQAIQETAHTGHPGDGKIFVQPVGQVFTVRTGQPEL
ncbi:MAG: P-II family nitrogen regulator [Acidobacteria bacterium]|nr:P-II family nitrogen regulator [Acidobacteriota bacterium]